MYAQIYSIHCTMYIISKKKHGTKQFKWDFLVDFNQKNLQYFFRNLHVGNFNN